MAFKESGHKSRFFELKWWMGGGYGLAVVLKVSIPGVDADTTLRLAEAAHQVCPYSNATRGNIEVMLEAN